MVGALISHAPPWVSVSLFASRRGFTIGVLAPSGPVKPRLHVQANTCSPYVLFHKPAAFRRGHTSAAAPPARCVTFMVILPLSRSQYFPLCSTKEWLWIILGPNELGRVYSWKIHKNSLDEPHIPWLLSSQMQFSGWQGLLIIRKVFPEHLQCKALGLSTD